MMRDIMKRWLSWIFSLPSFFFGTKLVLYNENDFEDILFPKSPSKEQDDEEEVLASKIEAKCERRIGKVTKLEPHGMIDGMYYFNTADLQQKNIAVGQSVRYLAYRENENQEWVIKQIRLVEKDEWESGSSETHVSKVTGKYTAVKKTLVAQVLHRRGRILTMEPNNMTCNLDSVQSEFLPVEGDYILLTAIVELREEKNDVDNIISIELVKPLRSRPYEGRVSHISDDGNTGIVGNQMFFTKAVCEGGFMPRQGDKVVVRAIESKQGALIWRAIHLIIMETSSEHASLVAKIQQERLFDSKNGVMVTPKCDNMSIKINEKTVFKVTVENAGTEPQALTSVVLKNSEISRVMTLKTEIFDPLTIEPGCFEEIEVEATARSSGHYSELAIFRFQGDWQIGCLLDIYVHVEDAFEKHTSTINQNLSSYNTNSTSPNDGSRGRRLTTFQAQRQARQQLARTMPTKTGFIVPGVRPVRPTAFIPKMLPDFPVPENLRSIMLGDGISYKNQSAVAAEMEEAFPYLTISLSESNYLMKFHMLLHMEDLEHACAIKKFDNERVSFTKQGEYLSLEILNLAECKPSLIIGDKLFATDIGQRDNKDATRYEGHIHRITSNSIKLKFSEAFHQQYDGKSMSVEFWHSRTGIRRAHQALNEAYKNLGRQFLFPTSLGISKQPQVNIVGEFPRTNSSDQPHVCTSDQPDAESVPNSKSGQSEQPRNNAIPKSGQPNGNSVQKSKPKVIRSRKDEHSLAVLNDTESGASDVDEEPAHSYASVERPRCADRPIKWEEESRKSRITTPEYAEQVSPPREQEQSNHGPCRDVIVKWVNKSLNKYQRNAVRNILRGEARPLPYIIHGPPGTGKTITIVETILQIMYTIPESRILVATPSNSSADLLCERLLSWNLLRPGDLVRLVGYNFMNDRRMSPIIEPYCTCMDTKNLDKNGPQTTCDEDGVKYSSRDVIGRHRITVSTCVSVGILYTMGFPKNHFTHVIVDEAGQCTEPEIMIPLAFLSSQDGQAILAGDPRQLGPVVLSRLAASMGLGDSLLNRLYTRFPYFCDLDSYPETLGYDPRLVTRLLYNYRSSPTILELYSSLFYNSDLIPQVCPGCSPERQIFEKIKSNLRESSRELSPVIFYGIKGMDKQDDDSPSWYNEHEAVKVVSFLSGLYDKDLKTEDIGIVTPYQKQVMKIRELIRTCGFEVPKVGTVEEFQGQERNVIIISTVRSNEQLLASDLRHSLGFLSSQARLNVAISRARAMLIIIGNPHLLAREHSWSKLIKMCIDRGYYDGCDVPVGLMDESPY